MGKVLSFKQLGRTKWTYFHEWSVRFYNKGIQALHFRFRIQSVDKELDKRGKDWGSGGITWEKTPGLIHGSFTVNIFAEPLGHPTSSPALCLHTSHHVWKRSRFIFCPCCVKSFLHIYSTQSKWNTTQPPLRRKRHFLWNVPTTRGYFPLTCAPTPYTHAQSHLHVL